ncbi:methyltransferase domain-containing protein [Lophiotrema nucula]|uniref:Methyltransferase domain-containing protein n=1 Tax=Lophiotrema nucula TaxID=690887 RepID=A0A6A5YF79_9PLEO|nr:methyltransferase domain-containing protein [Lophiotrema nucula]
MPEKDITGGNPLLARVYAATTPAESRAAYEEWAATYDDDMVKEEYVAPGICAAAIEKYSGIDGMYDFRAILDAGCGTGRCGLELRKLGAKTIDGVDYSPGMLSIAQKTNTYRALNTADLSKSIPQIEDESYDAVICVGTLTQGHVGPDPALGEFVRAVKKGGVVVATVLETIWESEGYEAEVGRLEREGKVEVVEKEVQSYRKSSGVGGRVLVLRKL